MSEAFVGEIRVFANSFVPAGWFPCDGRTVPINQCQILAAVIGTIYGGDGRTTVGLPNLNGKAAVDPGMAATGGINTYQLGKTYGAETVTITATTMAAHKHQLQKKNTNATPPATAKTAAPSAKSDLGGLSNDVGNVSYQSGTVNSALATTPLFGTTLGTAGTAAPTGHENRQPFVAMYFGINYDGVFPVKP